MVCSTQECWQQPLCDGFYTSWIVLKLPFSVVMLVVQTCPRGLLHLWSFCDHLLWIWQLSFVRITMLWFVFYYTDPSKYLHTPELVVLGRCNLVSWLLLDICTCFFEESWGFCELFQTQFWHDVSTRGLQRARRQGMGYAPSVQDWSPTSCMCERWHFSFLLHEGGCTFWH